MSVPSMFLRCVRLFPLPLFLLLTSLAAAQTDPLAPPPIKMGLWQSEVSVDLSGIPNMPSGAASAPKTSTHQSCMTPDSWKKAMQSLHNQQPSVNCTTSNMQQDAHHLSFDEQCSTQQGYNTSIHVDMQLDSDQAMHGTSAVKMSGPAFPQGMTMNSTIRSKFLSADCGSLKPGEAKAVNP